MKANLGKRYTTHMGILTKVLTISSGDVLELGTGPSSTPLLHWVCKDMRRSLISYENDPEFYNYARQYRSKLHRIVLVKDWDEIDTKTHRGLILIDHSPAERRSIDIIRFKDSADFIVIHDTDEEQHYGYQKTWPYFKYVYTWKECRPWVSVVSNYKDLSEFKKT